MVNTIWFRFDLMRFGKYFSVCMQRDSRAVKCAFYCARVDAMFLFSRQEEKETRHSLGPSLSRALLKPLNTIVVSVMYERGFRGCHQIIAERRQPLQRAIRLTGVFFSAKKRCKETRQFLGII